MEHETLVELTQGNYEGVALTVTTDYGQSMPGVSVKGGDGLNTFVFDSLGEAKSFFKRGLEALSSYAD